jgi:hypothetical protein
MPSDVFQLDQQNLVFRGQVLDQDGNPKDLTGDDPFDMEFRKPDNTKVTENGITEVDLPNGIVEYTETTTSKSNVKGAWEYRPVTNSKLKGRWIQFIVSD